MPELNRLPSFKLFWERLTTDEKAIIASNSKTWDNFNSVKFCEAHEINALRVAGATVTIIAFCQHDRSFAVDVSDWYNIPISIFKFINEQVKILGLW